MTATNGSFFVRADPKYKPVPDDGRIEVVPFLDATRQVIPFFDLLGKAFSPVKSDILGNVKKLQKRYDADPDRYKTFNDMLEHEKAEGKNKDSNCATVALLWLKRALKYINLFLMSLVDDHEKGTKTENLVPFVKAAYEESLKRYHGWIVQGVFSVVSHAAPYRKDLIKHLAYGVEGMDDEVISDTKQFIELSKANVDTLDSLYLDMGLESPDKV